MAAAQGVDLGTRPLTGLRWQAAADVGDQLEQVRAVNGGVSEARSRPVAVRVKAATATGDDRAFLAGLASQATPCWRARMPGCAATRSMGSLNTSDPVSGAPSNAALSESTCS